MKDIGRVTTRAAYLNEDTPCDKPKRGRPGRVESGQEKSDEPVEQRDEIKHLRCADVL